MTLDECLSYDCTAMLTGIEIRNYRGIREGNVDGFGPVNLILGPNGSGKSSLLEAIFLGSLEFPTFKFTSHGYSGNPLIMIRHNENGFPNEEMWFQKDTNREIVIDFKFGNIADRLLFKFQAGQKWLSANAVPMRDGFFGRLKLLDVRVLLDKSMERQNWDELLKSRADRDLIRVLNDVYKLNIESLTYSAGSQVLKVLFADRNYALNVDDLAAGMRIAFRLFFAIVLTKESAVLAEEFDGYQHAETLPRFVEALFQLSSKMKTQLFLASHSLETVRVFVEQARKLDSLKNLTVFQTRLTPDGSFQASRLTGSDAQTLLSGGIDIRRTA